MDRFEKRLDATLKIVQTGMKMLVKMQHDQKELRQTQKETWYAIDALIEAQQRTDARLDAVGKKVDRLVDTLLKNPPSGKNGKH